MKRLLFITTLAFIAISTYAQEIRVKYPNFGYRSFVGAGVFLDDIAEGFSISTSHGMQLSPAFFVGGGFAIQHVNIYSEDPESNSYGCVPIFINLQWDWLKKKVAPFIDLRLGTQFGGLTGTYFAPAFGCRFGHFNLALSVETKQCTYYEKNTKQGEWFLKETEKSIVVPSIRLFFDMGAR